MSDVAGPADEPAGELLEGRRRPSSWARRWSAAPRAVRVLVLVLVTVLAVGAGSAWVRDRAAERAQAQRIDLSVALGVWTWSTAPSGGEVVYFVVVGNEGTRPVSVTGIAGGAQGLVLRASGGKAWPVAAGDEVRIPLSVRLTCPGPGADGDGFALDVTVRREDGSSSARRVRPEPADLLLGVAGSLCSVQPHLRDQELSGPVLDR